MKTSYQTMAQPCVQTHPSAVPPCQPMTWSLGLLARQAVWLALALCALLLAAPAHAKRIALVVGNAAYADKPLPNPVNDAELMQRTLQGLGFEVSLLRNASRRDLLAGLRDFEAQAANAEVALFYFAGHGTQVAGSNYLIPLQAQIRGESDVPDEAVDAGSVLRRIENARAKVGLVVLDACRDNPYAGASRSSARGLGRSHAPSGTIVAFATAPGTTADDGPGRNGVYTEQLVRHLNMPGLDLREVLDRTAQEVERLTGGKQRPREEVGLRERVVLKPSVTLNLPPPKTTPASIQQVTPLAPPTQVAGTPLDDLQREESVRRDWAQWQTRMKTDFEKIDAFGGSSDLQAKAWERFLITWQQDNPLSQDDDTLRQQATANIAQLTSGTPTAEPPVQTTGTAPAVNAMALIDGRYQVVGEGGREVKDHKTGLIWQRCNVGQRWKVNRCSGLAKSFSFDELEALARDGWRVPTLRELHSLVHCTSGTTQDSDDPRDGLGPVANHCSGVYQTPTISLQAFPDTKNWYWTSTVNLRNTRKGWHVLFFDGNIGNFDRENPSNVRLVRSSP